MRLAYFVLFIFIVFIGSGTIFSDIENYGKANYEKLEKTAENNGFVKVIVKISVEKIRRLTANSNSYRVIRPGEGFSYAQSDAALDLENAIMTATHNVLSHLNNTNYKVNHYYSTIPFVALDVSEEALAILSELPEVLSIVEDKPRRLIDPLKKGVQSSKGVNTRSDLSKPMLDNTVNIIGANNAWTDGYTGSGWYVAILDTGIRSSHDFFSGKTIVESCYSAVGHCPGGVTEKTGAGSAVHYPNTYDGYDHGTHVAGIATGNNGSLYGVAKDADIIAIQVFSKFDASACGGSPCVMSYDSDQVKGLERVYTLRGSYSIASANMSLGGGQYSSACDSESQKTAIDNLRAVGIATVIATGNDGYCGYIGSPACISTAISVGSSTDADAESSFNNWHATLQKLFAPGSAINSATGTSDSSYASWSGTSMATPHVAGAWALMKHANPSGSVTDLYNALSTTGTSITSVCDGYTSPIPRINVDLAIDSLIPDSISLTSPNGGESWTSGTSQNITWDNTGVSGNVKITLWQNGSNLGTIVSGIAASTGSYSWTVGSYIGGTATAGSGYTVKIKEVGTAVGDTSDSSFSIAAAPTITLTSPNGGESWSSGSSENITWDSTNVSGNVKITLWQNGSNLGTIVSGIAASTGSYSWTVGSYIGGTATAGSGYTVKIKEVGTAVGDTSDSSFSITSAPSITLTAPNGGETLALADSFDITWNSTGVSGNVKITLWQNGSKLGTIVSGISASSGSYTWTVGTYSGGYAAAGVGYTVKIKEVGTAVADTSDSSFTISASALTVMNPNGGESLTIDGTTNIIWSAPSVGGNVKITLWQNGSKIGNIVSGIPASAGTYSWTIGSYIGGKATVGGGYTIKIKEIGTTIGDTSNGAFTLQ